MTVATRVRTSVTIVCGVILAEIISSVFLRGSDAWVGINIALLAAAFIAAVMLVPAGGYRPGRCRAAAEDWPAVGGLVAMRGAAAIVLALSEDASQRGTIARIHRVGRDDAEWVFVSDLGRVS
jgi:hypothetical protein